jgi:para-aminobenzoate synthetase/4-amino-4-deoxychorismate lyase
VAIRTLVLEDGIAHMGVGGGIVADSEPEAEYRECQLKARFLTVPRQPFQLIETMLSDRGTVHLLPLHLDRLAASAGYFDFAFDREMVETRIAAFLRELPEAGRFRVRLLLDASGELVFSQTQLAGDSLEIAVHLSSYRVDSADTFLRHKTTRRALYDRELASAREEGFDEVLFCNERGELTEGAISTLFLRRGGRLLTPPLSSGVLPGVLRRHILATDPTAEESILTLDDLYAPDALFLGNSVRGLRRVTRIETGEPQFLSASLDVSSG